MNTNETAGVKPALPAPPLLSEEQFSTACEVVGKLHDYACKIFGDGQHVSFFKYTSNVRAVIYVNDVGKIIEAKTLGGLLRDIAISASSEATVKRLRIAKLKAELAELEASA